MIHTNHSIFIELKIEMKLNPNRTSTTDDKWSATTVKRRSHLRSSATRLKTTVTSPVFPATRI